MMSITLIAVSCGDTTHVNVNGVDTKVIQGLKPVDVYGNFEKKGFKTEKNFGEPNTFTSRMSDLNGDYTVMATATGTTVIYVDAAITNLSDGINSMAAGEFLGYVASVPYSGSHPATAKNWVKRHIDSTSDTTISGVKFNITANNNSSRILKLSGL